MPFGAGPRVCIGAVFALSEAQIMLATMLQRYTLAIESKRPVMPVGRLTVQPSYAPMFRLQTVPYSEGEAALREVPWGAPGGRP